MRTHTIFLFLVALANWGNCFWNYYHHLFLCMEGSPIGHAFVIVFGNTYVSLKIFFKHFGQGQETHGIIWFFIPLKQYARPKLRALYQTAWADDYSSIETVAWINFFYTIVWHLPSPCTQSISTVTLPCPAQQDGVVVLPLLVAMRLYANIGSLAFVLSFCSSCPIAYVCRFCSSKKLRNNFPHIRLF